MKRAWLKKSLVGILGLGLSAGSLKNLSGCDLNIPQQVYDDVEYLMNLPEDPDINTLNEMTWKYGIPTMYFYEINKAPNLEGTYSLYGTEYETPRKNIVSGPHTFHGTWTFYDQDSEGNIKMKYQTSKQNGAGSANMIIRGEKSKFTIYSTMNVYGPNFNSECSAVFEGTQDSNKNISGSFVSKQERVLSGSGTDNSFGSFYLTKE